MEVDLNGDSWSARSKIKSDFQEEEHKNMSTEIEQQKCLELFEKETAALMGSHPEGFCQAFADPLSCWPPTPFNQTAVVKCFKEFRNVLYDETQNATKRCLANGSWSGPNYANCKEIIPEEEPEVTIYFVGYAVSLIALAVAVGIFTYFKELRCLRNTIHMNLMWSHMLMYSMWILILIVNFGGNNPVGCIFLVTFFHYFYTTTFFWMFVEGLYLYILVVETYRRDNFKLKIYVCIGWGLPLLFVLIWAIAKGIISPTDTNECNWFEQHNIDWIYQAPTIAVLLLNMLFLIAIMWVLITKLRSTNHVENHSHRQQYKAAKALLVLMPLLGITYVITFYAPTTDYLSKQVFENIRAVVLSTQGFTVALFFCFLNTEVQNTVKHRFENWKVIRSLGTTSAHPNSHPCNWSRTGSIRITEWTIVTTEMDEHDGSLVLQEQPNHTSPSPHSPMITNANSNK